MSGIDYFQINLIPAATMLILRWNAYKTLPFTWRNRALRFLMILIAGILFLDATIWSLSGIEYSWMKPLLMILNTIYFVVEGFCAFLCFLYVYDILHHSVGQRGKNVFPKAIPLLLFYILLVINMFVPFFFMIDEHNKYVRMSGFWICVLVEAGYIFAAVGMAVNNSLQGEGKNKSHELHQLILLMLVPVFGGVFQIYNYGIDLLWLFAAIAMLIYYIDLQKEYGARDSLTGLNNRGKLDRYVSQLELKQQETEDWYFMIMDVDSFKKVNDTYGHVVGDEVLRMIADVLKRRLGDQKVLLARYGGDEFAAVIQGRKESEIQRLMSQLIADVQDIKWRVQCPWKLNISIGYACYDGTKIANVEELIAIADAHMYEQKHTEEHST